MSRGVSGPVRTRAWDSMAVMEGSMVGADMAASLLLLVLNLTAQPRRREGRRESSEINRGGALTLPKSSERGLSEPH